MDKADFPFGLKGLQEDNLKWDVRQAACAVSCFLGRFCTLDKRITAARLASRAVKSFVIVPEKGAFKMARLAVITALLLSSSVLSGCVPLAIGAGGAIAADTIAEDRGKDLF